MTKREMNFSISRSIAAPSMPRGSEDDGVSACAARRSQPPCLEHAVKTAGLAWPASAAFGGLLWPVLGCIRLPAPVLLRDALIVLSDLPASLDQFVALAGLNQNSPTKTDCWEFAVDDIASDRPRTNTHRLASFLHIP